jgi:membrane dipeptidase
VDGPDREERRVIPVFDGHNDALTSDGVADLARGRAGGHLDLPRMREGGMRGGIFSPSPEGEAKVGAFTADADREPATDATTHGSAPAIARGYAKPLAAPVAHEVAAAGALAAAGRLFALERAGEVVVARTIADVDAALEAGAVPVAVLGMEGAEAIDPGLESLPAWHALGLRCLGPVWSRANAFATGVQFVFPSSPDIGPGLTDAGVALVKACAELGILVDLSHMNERGFWDIAGLGLGPLVASHAGAHAVAAASRNLTDRQLDAIADSGGLVGIVFATVFTRPDFASDPDTPLSLIAAHAGYVADRIGVEHVALGSDFDGATVPAALGDVAGLPRLLDAFRAAGFTEPELERIAWSNWRRVLDAWWR